jgi:KUP system potassium uptake protein
MHVIHTSAREIGQIYLPAINWMFLVSVVAAVIGFGSSTNLRPRTALPSPAR